MVRTKIIETTEKFDKDGNLIERVTREETSDDDTIYYPNIEPVAPTKIAEIKPEWIYKPEWIPWWLYQPKCTCIK